MAADADSEQGIPTEIIDILTGVWEELTRLGAPLTEEQWKTPTALPAWTVQDLYSHLIGTERMLEGMSTAPPRDPLVETPHVHNAIGDINENEVLLRKDRPGADVYAEWEDVRATRESTLRAADAEYFAQRTMTPTGPGTMTDFLATRILDCWVHEQDVRWALGTPAPLDGPAAEHTVDRLVRAIPMVVGKRAATPEGSAVRVVIAGNVERDLVCQVERGRAHFVDTITEPCVSVMLTTEAFLQLALGRRPPDDLAGVQIDGDADLGRKVATHLNVMI